MSTVVYAIDAERTLLALPSTTALAIIDAVDLFAERGVGFVRRMIDDSGETRLYVGDHYVAFETTCNVVRVVAIAARSR